jgi:hypothetical protein
MCCEKILLHHCTKEENELEHKCREGRIEAVNRERSEGKELILPPLMGD